MTGMSTARTVPFTGYDWLVKRFDAPVGPGPNVFSDDVSCVSALPDGGLRLAVTRSGSVWRCAEVRGPVLGHGRYTWTVETPLRRLDTQLVLGLFTWSDDPDQHHREIDVEVSAWGEQDTDVHGLCTVQPSGTPGQLVRFPLPRRSRMICGVDWTPGRVEFLVDGRPVLTVTGPGVPDAGDARPRMNPWLFRGAAPAERRVLAVVIRSFTFTPANG